MGVRVQGLISRFRMMTFSCAPPALVHRCPANMAHISHVQKLSNKYGTYKQCPANMAHISQSRLDSGLGVEVKVFKPFEDTSSSPGSGPHRSAPKCLAKAIICPGMSYLWRIGSTAVYAELSGQLATGKDRVAVLRPAGRAVVQSSCEVLRVTVEEFGVRIWGSGFRVWGLGFRSQGLGFRI
jgi:hypothetical protein